MYRGASPLPDKDEVGVSSLAYDRVFEVLLKSLLTLSYLWC